MNPIAREIFKWCWFLAMLGLLWRAEASLVFIDRARLSTEPCLCSRTGMPLRSGQCVMDAVLHWSFPSGAMRVSPITNDGFVPAFALSPDEQRSLSYGYSTEDYHLAGGRPAAVVVLLVGACLALLPFYRDLRRILRHGFGIRAPAA